MSDDFSRTRVSLAFPRVSRVLACARSLFMSVSFSFARVISPFERVGCAFARVSDPFLRVSRRFSHVSQPFIGVISVFLRASFARTRPIFPFAGASLPFPRARSPISSHFLTFGMFSGIFLPRLSCFHPSPNQALQRTPRSCHVGSLRSRRAISESSLSLRSLGVFHLASH